MKRETLSVPIGAELRARLEAECAELDRPVAWLVRRILQEWYGLNGPGKSDASENGRPNVELTSLGRGAVRGVHDPVIRGLDGNPLPGHVGGVPSFHGEGGPTPIRRRPRTPGVRGDLAPHLLGPSRSGGAPGSAMPRRPECPACSVGAMNGDVEHSYVPGECELEPVVERGGLL